MKRRQFLAGLVIFIADASNQAASNSERMDMPGAAPERIRLVPDDWHVEHVGRLVDGRLFWVNAQIDPAGGATKDFVCTFVFDESGGLIAHSIELIGTRGTYPEGSVATEIDRHIATLGEHVVTDIWVRPFSIESNSALFGLIPRQTEDGNWRVEFMPGNTLSFYAPWEAGGYDT